MTGQYKSTYSRTTEQKVYSLATRFIPSLKKQEINAPTIGNYHRSIKSCSYSMSAHEVLSQSSKTHITKMEKQFITKITRKVFIKINVIRFTIMERPLLTKNK
jgi:hypothetical protein